MNAGDSLSVAAITQYGTISGSFSNSSPISGTLGDYYLYSGRYFISVTNNNGDYNNTTSIYKYVAGSWALYDSISTYTGTVTQSSYVPQTGLYRTLYARNGAGGSMSNSMTLDRAYYGPRTQGQKMRCLYSDFSGVGGGGESLTAVHANAGHIITY